MAKIFLSAFEYRIYETWGKIEESCWNCKHFLRWSMGLLTRSLMTSHVERIHIGSIGVGVDLCSMDPIEGQWEGGGVFSSSPSSFEKRGLGP